MKIVEDISYSSFPESELDLYLPEIDDFKTIVYFHGGGLSSGDKRGNQYVEIAKSFVEKGYAFASCNYRMYPLNRFPSFLEDAASAVKYIKDNIKSYHGNGEIIISGQSAGAWMSLMLMTNKKYLNDVKMDPLEIKGWIIDSAQCTSHFNVIQNEEGLDELAQRIDEYAPLYFINKEFRFTKCLLIYYEYDMPCRPEQNILFKTNILSYNKDADIESVRLKGYHCQGSSIKDEDGEYEYSKVSLDWLKRKGL